MHSINQLIRQVVDLKALFGCQSTQNFESAIFQGGLITDDAFTNRLLGQRFKLQHLIRAVFKITLLKKLRVQQFTVAKALQNVKPGAPNQLQNVFDGSAGYNRFDAGGPEFIVNPGFQDQLDTGNDGIRPAVGLDIGLVQHRIGFEIHGDVVHQAFFD